MPVVVVKSKSRATASAAAASLSVSLNQRIRQTTEQLLDAADRVLVVYEPSGAANIYYEGGSKNGTGAN